LSIEVAGLCKRFEAVTAVSDLELSVAPGEILGMVGVNGAGKTTCLRMLAGILPPTSGEIRIAGHPMDGDAVDARRSLAFVPDTPMLFDSLSTLEHLLFVAELYGVDEPGPRIDRLLDDFDLEDRRHATASSLSRGMRQKLAICCAFLHEPPVLLLDEPLTGLDPPGRRRMCDAIEQRARAGSAVIVSSHQLEIVQRISTRFLIVHEGQERLTGTLEHMREVVRQRREAELHAPVDDPSLESIFLYATGLDSAQVDDGEGERHP